jgi:hypothetical protein
VDIATVRTVLAAFEEGGVDTVRLKDRADAALLKERFGIEDD